MPLGPCPLWLVKASDKKKQGFLVDVTNLSLAMGVYPEKLKEAVIALLLKKPSSDPDDPPNYCPVSNVPVLGRMIERVIAKQLQSFLYNTSGPDPFQSSFCPIMECRWYWSPWWMISTGSWIKVL